MELQARGLDTMTAVLQGRFTLLDDRALQRRGHPTISGRALDYWMPGKNGIATARELKRIRPLVPMVILSELSQLPDETMGVVDRLILKDEGPQFLLSSIRTLLESAS
jgi:DNA-binding NarL/FixJ family response regulator